MTGSLVEDKPSIRIVWGSDYLALPRDPQPWLIEQLVPSGGAMLLYGKPKLGKSFAALGVAQAIADPSVEEWLGFPVLKHGPVVYIQVDTPRTMWASRVEKLRERGDVSQIGFVDPLLTPYPLDMNDPQNRAMLLEQMQLPSVPPVLVVVDTLREVHSGDENRSEPMKEIISSLTAVTRPLGAGLLLVAHSRKDNPEFGDDLMNDNRGNSYTVGRMDVICKLTEKQMLIKGRSIGETKVAIEQDEAGFIVKNAEKADSEANLKNVMETVGLSDRDRADMLAALEGIEPEAARSRIKRYKARLKGQ